MERYNPTKIEPKWQKIWEKENSFFVDNSSAKNPLYILDMFPYPSGAGLHMGHIENFTATDILARYKRMNGFDVLRPMGWDAFGLPAENYAIKTKIHPRKTTDSAISNFKKQIKQMGLSYDFARELGTQTPEYYKWTQWFFLLLYKNNLAYKKKAKVNWDPVDQTVLANEQVLPDGTAERSGAKVVQKELEQWFFKITDFAENLFNDLDSVDWPAYTVVNQKNWIGKSEGYYIDFELSMGEKIKVFTTRADTLMGASFVVLSCNHNVLQNIKKSIENWEEVESYIKESSQKADSVKIKKEKEVSGVLLDGVTATHPISKKPLPVFVADYVLAEYGTGAIMAVPAHDSRDNEFAKKYKLEIIQVIEPTEKIEDNLYEGYGTLINSGEFDGLSSEQAKKEISKKIKAEHGINYKLRDWLISRQRYWGCPIPIVYSQSGEPHPVPEEHLPWTLPDDVEFLPKGSSPLAKSNELKKRTENIFGKGWTPEVDTMDTFVDSSWYFFRFCDNKNEKEFADKKAIKQWMPVDLYMGGAEHTVLHLLYARFFTKVLNKLGYIDFTEPFKKLRHQGTILGEDNLKMSKSRGNIINPDDIASMYGADTARMFVMFMGPLEDAKPWNSQNIMGVNRFLGRVWGIVQKTQEKSFLREQSKEILYKRHYTTKKVTQDIEALRYNTAISSLMEMLNEMYKYSFSIEDVKIFLLLLSPFAPHITEELWEKLGEKNSIHAQTWPKYKEEFTTQQTIEIPVFINGKTRATIEIDVEASEEQIKQKALEQENIKKHIQGKEIQKTIIKDNKFVNFIV